MTTLSNNTAINLLLNEPAKYASPEAVRNLATQLAIESPGQVTVLYSGSLGGGVTSNTLVEGMVTQGEDIRIINRTQAADFLNSIEFRSAVANAFGVQIIDLETGGNPANEFLYNPTKGVWAENSARFAASATGDVRIISPFADASRTLTQVELVTLLETPGVTSINGISKDVFKSIFDKTGSIGEVGKAVSASSYSLVAEMEFHSYVETNLDGTPKLNSDGTPRILIDKVDSTSLFKGLAYEGTLVPGDELNASVKTSLNQALSSERATLLGEGWRNLGLGAKTVAATEGVFKGLGVLGIGVTAYQIHELADQAQAAYERGDVDGASKIIADGSLQIAGGWAGGVAATAFASGFFAPLLPTGPAGNVLYLVLVGGSGIGGAIFGESAVKSLLEAVSSESSYTTTDLWKTTQYANGVVVREQTQSPYADNPTAELGAVRFGSEWVSYSKEVLIPAENQTTVGLWYGASGVIRWIYDENGNKIGGSKTSFNADGGSTTTVVDASGQFVSATTAMLNADGGQTVTTSFPDRSLHVVQYAPPSEAQLSGLQAGVVREVSDVTFLSDGQRLALTYDGSGLLLQTSTLSTFEDGSTSELVRYSDGRNIRTNTDSSGQVTSRSSIQYGEEDGSSIETVNYPNGRVVQLSYDADGNLLSEQEIASGGQTLQNAIGQYGGTLLDALSLLKAIQSGEPLPIVVSGLRLANDLSTLNGNANLNLSGLANVGGSLLSLLALDAALERGDNLGAITAGAQALSFAATAYTEFISASYGDAINAAADGYGAAFDAASGLGEALPYLNLINSIANGDETGVAVAAMSMMGVPYIGWAYAVYSLIDGLFGGDDIPDPWGTGEFVWAGSGVGVSAVGETGGQEAVSGVMSATLNTLNALIEQVRTQNPGSELGLIAQRLPSAAYDMSGYRFTNIDPLTGVEQNPALRFDTSGNPYNAEPGTPESYQSIVEGMVRSALQRGAIAPQWEVRTAQMQTQAGDPRAGLSEEERAGRDGQLAAPLTGNTQVFRPVVLDLDGDGIETTAQADGVAFDVDDSGYLKQTAWVKGDDAMLVLDRDYNGQFDSGRELFSNATVGLNRRGLAGMGWVDANHDGKLNSADPVWNELKLWRDLDQDGTQDAGEVQTLEALGVSELNHAMGTFTQNGATRQLASPNLQADKDGTRVTVVPEGILVQASEDGRISLLVTRITDKTAVQANRDGVTGFEDTELIVSAADLLANDTLGGMAGRDLTITGLTNFRHGTGFLDANGFVHFTPEANHAGDDAGFDYVTQAANGQTGTGTVDITLQGVNDAPTLDAVNRVTRPVYGYTPVIIYSDSESGSSQYAGGGEPIYQPYGIRRDDFGDSGSVETVVLNPPPGQWNIEYHTTPLGQEDSGAGQVVGADVDDPATSLRYEVLNQPQFGSVSLLANGQFQYTSWKEPGVASDRIVYQGQYAGLKDGTLYYPGNLPSHALYPTTDVFQVRITDPAGASTITSIEVPHYGPYLPPTPVGGGGKKPIAIDLDGNGFEFVNVNDSTVFFDVNGDGWRRRTAWVAPTDGLLAYDINGDGKIDQAGEISFVHYKDGAQTDLEGLAAFDSNGDGVFNAADAKWSNFGVWQDANQNGETDAGEFRRLGEMGVTGVRLTSDGRFEVINGQTVHGVGAMTLADGSELAMADVTLAYSDETRVVLPDGTVITATPSNFSPNGEQLLGTDGNDLILGKNGNNIVQGYAGDDVILEDGGNDLIDGGDGNDTLYAGADNDVVQAGSGDDAVFAGLGEDLVFGGEGNDAILAEGGNDVVFGGDGNDLIAGGWGNDVLSGDDGNDQLLGELGNDALFGRDGDDELQGMDGNDLLDGGNGNDLLDGGSGVDQLLGGMGDDTYTVDDVADAVVEWADAGTDTVRTDLDGYVLGEHIENLVLLGTMGLTGTGNTANNRLTGNVGNNLLLGGAGNDRLDGGLGSDTLVGGVGDDVYWADNAGDAIVEQEGEGFDTVRSSVSHSLAAHVEHLVLTGIQATDGTGNGLDNLLTGNTSNNRLDGGLGADTMLGGRGNDTYWVENSGDVVLEQANEGLDTVVSQIDHTLAANVENLVLSGVADLHGTGNELDNVLSGNGGNNQLDGGLGADTLVGGLGNDTYVVDNAADAVVEDADAGTDHVLASVSHELAAQVERLTLTGSDHIDGVGNALANQMQGNDGNNRLDGAAGADTLAGGAGDDTYVVDNAGDQVLEWFGAGEDTVLSSISFVLPAELENLVLIGNAPVDGTGNELNNRLTGNAASNVLDGGTGNDAMAGGNGDDTYVVNSANDTALEWAQGGTDTVRSSLRFVLPEHVENLILTGWADTNGTGNTLDNLLRGNAGNNVLAGLAGDDVLQGGDGHDTLDGGLGQDHLLGGRGDDRYLFRTGEGLDHIDDEQGTDTVIFGVGLSLDNVALRVTEVDGIATAHVRILNSGGCEQQDQGFDFSVQKNALGQWVSPIERFEFSDGSVRTLDDLLIKTRVTKGSSRQTVLTTGRDDDVIYAGPRTDTIRAGSGHDVVFASSGGDLAYGEGGDDYLQGGTGDDVLDGGCGTDVLSGSNGQDRLLGGGGNDALLGGHQRDSIDGGDGSDFLAGGKHDDTLWTGSGHNVISFNQGDGRDIVHSYAGSSNTLSLGGGIREQDLTLAKSGNDLVLSAGGNNQVTFKDWYLSPTQQTFSTLQVVESVGGTATGWAIDSYDFKALVQSFDVSRQASSSNWRLTSHLLDVHLASEDRAAWGGELATRYAAGGESALSLSGAQSTMSPASFAVQTQEVGSRFNSSMGNFQLN